MTTETAIAERVAVLTAHRACHSAEHDPENGRIHGYCIVCGVPFPCEYVGHPPALSQQPEATLLREQPCGCVICVCEDEKQCHGCGAKHCGNRTDHPAYVEQQPEARGITPEWVIGYFPSDVTQEYREAVTDAFTEFAALNPKPEAQGVVKRPTDAEIEEVARAIMKEEGFALGEGGSIKAVKQGGNPRAIRWWRMARKGIAAITGGRNG